MSGQSESGTKTARRSLQGLRRRELLALGAATARQRDGFESVAIGFRRLFE